MFSFIRAIIKKEPTLKQLEQKLIDYKECVPIKRKQYVHTARRFLLWMTETKKNTLSVEYINMFCKYLVDEKGITVNSAIARAEEVKYFMRFVGIKKIPEYLVKRENRKRNMLEISRDKYNHFLEVVLAADKEHCCNFPIALLIVTALRASELLSLVWGDFSPDFSYLTVRRKGGKKALPTFITGIPVEYFHSKKSNDPKQKVFPVKLRRLRYNLKKISTKVLGVPLTPQDIRMITLNKINEVSRSVAVRHASHSDERTTQEYYLHETPEAQKKIVDVLSNVFN